MNKKALFALSLSLLLAASGCGDNAGASEPEPAQPDASASSEDSSVEAPPTEAETEEPGSDESGSETSELPEGAEESVEVDEEPDPLAGLTLNEYEDLSVTAEVLVRKALLPGSTIPVNVTITNNGDKSIVYTQGSGSFEIPQALMCQVEGLQPVLSKDHLGPVTMDFVMKELKPGETLQFALNVMAIEPHENFDSYTYDSFMEEKKYIGELDFAELQEMYPDLVAAQPGTYTGKAILRYSVPAEEGNALMNSDPTGYNEAEFTITITE